MRWLIGVLFAAVAALSSLVVLLYNAIRSIEDNDFFADWEFDL